MTTFDFTYCNPQLMREKARSAEFAGDDEKAALYAALAEIQEAHDSMAEDYDENKRTVEIQADYEAYKEFFFECFERLSAHYPAPSVTSDYDKSVIFDAIQKGEDGDIENYRTFFETCVDIVSPEIGGYDVTRSADRGEIYRALRKGVQNV